MEPEAILLADVSTLDPQFAEKLANLVELVAETIRRVCLEQGMTVSPWPVQGPTRQRNNYCFWTSSPEIREMFLFVGTEPGPSYYGTEIKPKE